MTDDHFHYNDDSCSLRQVLVTTWRKVEPGREDERGENCGREEIHQGSCDHYVGQGWDDYDGFSNLIMMVVDGIEELRWGSVFENIIVMTPITLIMTLVVLECRWWWKPEPREVVGVLLRCVQEEKVGHLIKILSEINQRIIKRRWLCHLGASLGKVLEILWVKNTSHPSKFLSISFSFIFPCNINTAEIYTLD